MIKFFSIERFEQPNLTASELRLFSQFGRRLSTYLLHLLVLTAPLFHSMFRVRCWMLNVFPFPILLIICGQAPGRRPLPPGRLPNRRPEVLPPTVRVAGTRERR